jgi:tRNA-dependent cyclodipeptide synthase
MVQSLEYPKAPHDSATLQYEHHGEDGLEGRFQVSTRLLSPAYALGLDLLNQEHTVLFGMSPGNGYFSRRRIEIAIGAFAQLSGRVATLVPDTIALHTYRALGYAEKDARSHVRKNSLSLKNRATRAMEQSRARVPGATLWSLDWNNDVATIPGIDAAYAQVEQLFASHEVFRADVLATARTVLEARESAAPESAVESAAQYLLWELAFISVCRDWFGTDVIIPYHKPFTIGARFCEGFYGAPVPGVGWVLYEIQLEGELPQTEEARHDA